MFLKELPGQLPNVVPVGTAMDARRFAITTGDKAVKVEMGMVEASSLIGTVPVAAAMQVEGNEVVMAPLTRSNFLGSVTSSQQTQPPPGQLVYYISDAALVKAGYIILQ